MTWCTSCAAVGRDPAGAVTVSQPSPGRMYERPPGEIYDALADCYSLKPKKRILKSKAKAEIQRAWTLWGGDKSSPVTMDMFHGWLIRFRPYFLTFRHRGDQWEIVHGWLVEMEQTGKQ